MMFYPEEVLIPWAAMQLGRPIKWIEDRAENFVATTQERGQIHDAEIALTRDGRILGIKDSFLHDTGAYDPYGLTVPLNSQCTLLGPYDIKAYESEFTAVFTNKTIVTPTAARAASTASSSSSACSTRRHASSVSTVIEIRRRNFIPPDAFPYENEIIYQDASPLVYDSGNYEPILDRAREMIGWDRFLRGRPAPDARRRAARRESASWPTSRARGSVPTKARACRSSRTGKVSVVTGIGTQGQGHYTVLAQIAAEQLGVEVEDVEVTTGDTDQFHWGSGTFASRGAVVAGNAVHAAAKEVRKRMLALAAKHLKAEVDGLELAAGGVRVTAEPARFISRTELASLANPLRGAVEPGTEPGLEATKYFGPYRGATASGVHAMIIDVDPETMLVEVLDYVVVHDCGTVLNPMIVDGQVHGGVAQGLGNAFYEELVYDAAGQLLNASFMDFLVPTSLDVPRIKVGHVETPSPLNELGSKGAGEAGAIPTAALFVQAVENALDDPGPRAPADSVESEQALGDRPQGQSRGGAATVAAGGAS